MLHVSMICEVNQGLGKVYLINQSDGLNVLNKCTKSLCVSGHGYIVMCAWVGYDIHNTPDFLRNKRAQKSKCQLETLGCARG